MTTNVKLLRKPAPRLNAGEAKIILKQLVLHKRPNDSWDFPSVAAFENEVTAIESEFPHQSRTDLVIKEKRAIAQKELYLVDQHDLADLSPALQQKLRASGLLYVVGEASPALKEACIGEATFVTKYTNYHEQPIYRIDARLTPSPEIDHAFNENATHKQWLIDLHALEHMACPELGRPRS